MESKLTAVSWLVERFFASDQPLNNDHITQALAMEKENSEISFFAGYNYEGAFPVDEHEEYYKETFTEK
jgi:hypothetical protein